MSDPTPEAFEEADALIERCQLVKEWRTEIAQAFQAAVDSATEAAEKRAEDAVRERDEARAENEKLRQGTVEMAARLHARELDGYRQREEALAASQALVRSLREALLRALPYVRQSGCSDRTLANGIEEMLSPASAHRFGVPWDEQQGFRPDGEDKDVPCTECGKTWREHTAAALAESPAQVAPEPEAPICCEGMGWNRRAGRNFPHTSDCTRGVSPSSPEPEPKERT